MELGILTRGMEKLCLLRDSGIIKHIGLPTFGSYWEITIKENK